MTPITDYVILMNGQPFFSVKEPGSIKTVKAEALRRNPTAKIEVVIFTVTPYEPNLATNDSK
jgi:hypothetical protein